MDAATLLPHLVKASVLLMVLGIRINASWRDAHLIVATIVLIPYVTWRRRASSAAHVAAESAARASK